MCRKVIEMTNLHYYLKCFCKILLNILFYLKVNNDNMTIILEYLNQY